MIEAAAPPTHFRRCSSKALVLVNDARAALGMRPLVEWFKGYRHQADCCPISFALAGDETTIPLIDGVTALFPLADTAKKVAAAWGRAAEGDDGRQVVLPFAIARFTRLFDDGYYPTLTKPIVPERLVAA